jgi:large conductance mechanosensitive channel
MTGFKNFILKGNLVELAVAFIMGVAFASVVTTFTGVVTGTIGRIIGKNPNFDSVEWFKNSAGVGIPVGKFFTAVIAFLIMAAVVYFFIVTPYNKAKERFFPEGAAGEDPQLTVLKEIRDGLAAK